MSNGLIFLDYVVTASRIKVDEEKVKTTREWLTPEDSNWSEELSWIDNFFIGYLL